MAIDDRFIIRLSGREYPQYAGILGEAHRRGLVAIETELIQIPTEANDATAIVKATVTMEGMNGKIRTFTDWGDASPANTSKTIATALIRMASTRAKGRALRDAIDCGSTMLEELPEQEIQKAHRESEPRRSQGTGDRAPRRVVHPPTYESGGKTFKRVDLLRTLHADLERARNQGLPVEGALPEDVENAPNEALYAAGLALRHQLKTVAAMETKEGTTDLAL